MADFAGDLFPDVSLEQVNQADAGTGGSTVETPSGATLPEVEITADPSNLPQDVGTPVTAHPLDTTMFQTPTVKAVEAESAPAPVFRPHPATGKAVAVAPSQAAVAPGGGVPKVVWIVGAGGAALAIFHRQIARWFR